MLLTERMKTASIQFWGKLFQIWNCRKKAGTAPLDKQIKKGKNMFEKFGHDFYINFIKDDRYTWLLDGLKNTMIITVFALLIGICIGFSGGNYPFFPR